MSWNSSNTIERAVAALLLELQRQVEQRVQRRQRIRSRIDLQPNADPERSQREPETCALQKLVDPRARPALELRRVRALDPHGDVGEREDAVEVDEHGRHPLRALCLAQDAAQ